MKRQILYLAVLLMVMAGCSDRNDSHLQVPEADNDYKGGAVVELNINGLEESQIRDTHIYGFDSNQNLICHNYYPTPKELSLDMLNLANGVYTFVAVLNVGADFKPTSSRQDTDNGDIKLSELVTYILSVEADYPDMLTGMIQQPIEINKVAYMTIDIKNSTEGLGTSKVQLHLTLPGDEFPEYQAARSSATADANLRCIAEFYLKGSPDKCVNRTVTILTPAATGYNMSVEMPNGDYDLHIWADYTAKGSDKDEFYNTTNIHGITFGKDGYKGLTPTREGFYKSLSVSASAGSNTPTEVALLNPYAKYRIYTNDLDRYRELAAVNPGFPALEELTITVSYNGFLPNSFDVTTGKPSSSDTGFKYSMPIPSIASSDIEALIAADGILTNGGDSSTEVTVTVTDKNGKAISRVTGVNIKFRRGMTTTIKGDFLTAGVINPGVNIDTNWEGEFNVEF